VGMSQGVASQVMPKVAVARKRVCEGVSVGFVVWSLGRERVEG